MGAPFVLHYAAYSDLLGTERLHRSLKHKRHRYLKWQQKEQKEQEQRVNAEIRIAAEVAKLDKKRAGEKVDADADAAEKKNAAEIIRIEKGANIEQQRHSPGTEPEVVSKKVERTKKWKENKANRMAKQAAKQKARDEVMASETTTRSDAPDQAIASSTTTALRFILSVRSLVIGWHFFIGIVHFCVKIVQDELQHPCTRLVLSPSLLLWLPSYTSFYASVAAVLSHGSTYLIRSLFVGWHSLIGIVTAV